MTTTTGTTLSGGDSIVDNVSSSSFLLQQQQQQPSSSSSSQQTPPSITSGNLNSLRLVKLNGNSNDCAIANTLPSIVEAQVSTNITTDAKWIAATKNKTDFGGDFNGGGGESSQGNNSTNVWYLSPSGSEINEFSTSRFILVENSSNVNP